MDIRSNVVVWYMVIGTLLELVPLYFALHSKSEWKNLLSIFSWMIGTVLLLSNGLVLGSIAK